MRTMRTTALTVMTLPWLISDVGRVAHGTHFVPCGMADSSRLRPRPAPQRRFRPLSLPAVDADGPGHRPAIWDSRPDGRSTPVESSTRPPAPRVARIRFRHHCTGPVPLLGGRHDRADSRDAARAPTYDRHAGGRRRLTAGRRPGPAARPRGPSSPSCSRLRTPRRPQAIRLGSRTPGARRHCHTAGQCSTPFQY